MIGVIAIAIANAIANYSSTIFTCTTFFDFEKQDKWAAFCIAMDSIQSQHSQETLRKINKWVVVNEYSPNPRQDWTRLIHERYPFIDVIQKGPEEKGQAASMNIILRMIQGYTYWIHWEETWYCRRPCFDRMFDIMTTTNITQLQVTQHLDLPNWLDSDAHPRHLVSTRNNTQYYAIQPSSDTDTYLHASAYEFNDGYIRNWPLYSLLPSINRACHYRIGEFSTDPALWPIRFEWDYSRRWLLAGNTKAVLPDGPVVRDNSKHASTYAK